MYHTHHIIPKHMGGTDDPSNLVKVTIEEHAEMHKMLFEEHGKIEDYWAWKGLAGVIPKKELIKEMMIEASKKGSKARNERYNNDPKWAEELRQKLRKPKSTTENYLKPKTKEHAENISKAATQRPRKLCPKCNQGYTNANYDKHFNSCNGQKQVLYKKCEDGVVRRIE